MYHFIINVIITLASNYSYSIVFTTYSKSSLINSVQIVGGWHCPFVSKNEVIHILFL